MPSSTAADANRADPAALCAAIRERLASGRRTPDALVKELSGGSPELRRAARAAIARLVAAGEIAYRFAHGTTFLEPSFDRPVAVAPRIVLAPPGREPAAAPDAVVVVIAPGASFGEGRHPTTRLALRGIDFALGRRPPPPDGRLLDVGTGSGVLAIAAVKLGLAAGIGIDRDPCALAEARRNVAVNGLSGRIAITDRPLERIAGRFALVAANLRPPTLAALAAPLAARTAPGGSLVISGVRRGEAAEMLALYAAAGLAPVREEFEEGWLGAVLERAGR